MLICFFLLLTCHPYKSKLGKVCSLVYNLKFGILYNVDVTVHYK